MPSRNGIGAIRETVNGITFDSKLEAEAYRLLVWQFGKSNVEPHQKIGYTNSSDWMPILYHRIDFCVYDKYREPLHYVEIKGDISGNFKGKADYFRTILLLEALRPDVWSKYVIWVGSGLNSFAKGSKPCSKARPFPSNPSEVLSNLI